MSIFGIIFMVVTTLMMAELLLHVIIFAKTGKGGFEEAPFEIYRNYFKKAETKYREELKRESKKEGIYPVA